MDENSDPHGVEKKRGERFLGCFFVSLKKTVKIEGRKGGSYQNTIRHLSIESQQTEPAADRLATQGEIRSSPASF